MRNPVVALRNFAKALINGCGVSPNHVGVEVCRTPRAGTQFFMVTWD
jgi:hypothetical protein